MQAKILNASAGSGKTYQLAYKYVHDVVQQPTLYRHILAVTFTNKATEEMKSRILKEIHLLASGGESAYLARLCQELKLDAATVRKRAAEARTRILHDYSRFTVLTIDTFFQRILRAFIKELGIDLDYNVEIETASVLAKSADSLIEAIATDRDLLHWMTGFVEERIDEGRKWDVRDGILSLGGELFKEKNRATLVSPRSKKELRRIVLEATAHAEATKQQMRAAATEAVEIIRTAGLAATDFNGKSRSFVHYFYTVAAGELKAPTATAQRQSQTMEGWCAKGSPAETLVPRLQPLLATLCDIYARNIRAWNTCDLLRENYRSFALLSDLYAQVQRLCDEQNMLLLSETKYLLSEFIGRNDAPFIYEKAGTRYDRFMIDEFQDTSVREWENFLPLLKNAMAQSEETSVFIVGDIKQSIYRWRGGDWRILHEKARTELGAENVTVENLEENWRSLPQVVEFNNRMIERLVAADNAALNARIDEAAARGDIGRNAAVQLRDRLADAYAGHAQKSRRQAPVGGYVSVETFDERPPVVERICQLLDRGFRPSDIMILVRGATDGAKIASELLDFKSRNEDPRYRFDVMTQEALVIGNAPISSFVTAALRLTLNPDDTLNRAIYNRYLGHGFDRPLTEEERTFFRSIRLLSPEEAFERIVMRHGLQEDRQQTAYLQAVHEQIMAFCTNKIADIPLFLNWWDDQGSNRSLTVERNEQAIEILTVHKAKGLENKAVLIPYCSWQLEPKASGNVQNIVWAEAQGDIPEAGCFPVRFKKTMAESGFSEEYYRETVYAHVDNINLLYVALTRAAESLHIFIPQRGTRHVGSLLLEQLTADGEEARLEELTGRYTRGEENERFEFGDFSGPADTARKGNEARHTVLEHYPTAQADLRLRLPSQRYFEEETATELSPRNQGIMMHRAFENAETEADIEKAIEGMERDATLNVSEAAQLRDTIARALADPTAREWFDGHWQRIRNENEIIIPGQPTTRRPDRVMIDGERAVVVDYKFGEHAPARYRRQIGDYCALLRDMGYGRTEGYLWYVKLGKIERVE
ncbi:MAG: UvrD-helicase domain-containing protein [Alistipes sp.]|nr:UvrD-helicase domain-containing protein [Alistipes sp.]